eukprot:scaffold6944_cov118-Isochrysis_galbana.AAC.7
MKPAPRLPVVCVCDPSSSQIRQQGRSRHTMPAFLLVACLTFVLLHDRIVRGPEQHPGTMRAVRSLPCMCKLPTGCGEGDAALLRVLSAAGVDREPKRVSELTAGFCNSVFLVELPFDAQIGGETTVVVKLFSPLAKLRLRPSEARAHARGCDNQSACAQSHLPRNEEPAAASRRRVITAAPLPSHPLIRTARTGRPGRVRC